MSLSFFFVFFFRFNGLQSIAREREKDKEIIKKEKLSKQPHSPAPTATTVDPCPTVIQI